MNADTIKAFFTYLIAFTVVVGGFAVVYFTRSEEAAAEIRLLIGGFIGSALTFVFVQENSTRASRSAERQMAAGAASSAPTNIQNAENVQGGDPTIVNAEPKK